MPYAACAKLLAALLLMPSISGRFTLQHPPAHDVDAQRKHHLERSFASELDTPISEVPSKIRIRKRTCKFIRTVSLRLHFCEERMARKFGEDQENTGRKEEKSISCGEVQKQIINLRNPSYWSTFLCHENDSKLMDAHWESICRIFLV